MTKCNENGCFLIKSSSRSEGNNIWLSEQLDEMPKKRPKKKESKTQTIEERQNKSRKK